MKELLEILKAFFLGIVEGITEWLPISSTGHMILFDEFVRLDVSNAFKEMFFVVIQLGAICAVPVLFFDRLNPFSKKKSSNEKKRIWALWAKVAVGVLPAGVIGFLFDDFLDAHFYNYIVVSIALIVYGIAFILIEKLNKNRAYRVHSISELSYKDAALIGAFQMLSLIPGTSRSGSTILGGMMLGVSRQVSAEFSFFMAIPIMLGASLLKILKFIAEGFTVSLIELGLLAVGIIVSFFVSLIVIKFLMDFVRKHSFSVFGVYRIILGVLVVSYFLIF
jgi:undecaprenyl-diphosphatase